MRGLIQYIKHLQADSKARARRENLDRAARHLARRKGEHRAAEEVLSHYCAILSRVDHEKEWRLYADLKDNVEAATHELEGVTRQRDEAEKLYDKAYCQYLRIPSGQ